MIEILSVRKISQCLTQSHVLRVLLCQERGPAGRCPRSIVVFTVLCTIGSHLLVSWDYVDAFLIYMAVASSSRSIAAKLEACLTAVKSRGSFNLHVNEAMRTLFFHLWEVAKIRRERRRGSYPRPRDVRVGFASCLSVRILVLSWPPFIGSLLRLELTLRCCS